jgi:hypothetical protein
MPGDRNVVASLSLEAVFEWFREMPEQIERVVIAGGKPELKPIERRQDGKDDRSQSAHV